MDLQHQGLRYGGSTITQQLVKNSLLTSRKDFLRKYQEIVLAQEIDRHHLSPLNLHQRIIRKLRTEERIKRYEQNDFSYIFNEGSWVS